MFRRFTPRRLLISALWLVGLVVAAWSTLRVPPVLRLVIQAALEASTGTDVEVVDASWDGWGTLSVGRVRVFASDWPGAAGELLTLRGFRSSFHPLALLWGRIDLEDLHLESASLHIAERERPDAGEQINLQAIHPPTGGLGLSPTFRVQRIDLGRFTVSKYLVHGPEVVRQGADRAFQGEMSADEPPNKLRFRLVEVDASDALPDDAVGPRADHPPAELPEGIKVSGHWNDRTFEYDFEANRLDFSETVRPLLPLALQRSCDALGLRGTVSGITMSGSPARPISSAQLLVSDVAVNLLKVDVPVKWNRFSEGSRGEIVGKPRMAVERGRILLQGDRLSLRDFRGKLVSVRAQEEASSEASERPITVPLPAQLDMDLDFSGVGQPARLEDAEAWFESALAHCGVDIRLAVNDFALMPERGNRPWAVELPEQVVNVLDNFGVKGGHIDIHASARRPVSAASAPPGEFEISGSLRIHGGEGKYVNFPYPLRDVDADIGFKGDTMEVRSLTAVGSRNCRMAINGRVDGADDDAGVDLTVETRTAAPIDPALQNAFQPGPRRMFELLFARDLRERLVHAGLLPAEGTELGGSCHFRIRVQRERKGGSRVMTTGEILVADARVLCSRFPYPLHVSKGRIELKDESIVLPDREWAFTTAGGGSGKIDGEIRIPRVGDGREALPNVHLTVVNDRVNPLLLAAIPPEAWESGAAAPAGWPGERWSAAAQAMRALQLEGTLDLGGTIGSGPDGGTTLNLLVELHDGSFRPRNGPDRRLEASGLPWPEGFDLDAVRAKVQITEQEARLLTLEGRAGEGTVTATGRAGMRRRDRELDAHLRGAPLGLWLAPMLPEPVRASASQTWRACAASGSFDGDIHVQQTDDGADRRHATFSSRGVRFVSDGVPCELRMPRGTISIEGSTMGLHDVELEAIADGRVAGSLQADGEIALEASGRQGLSGCWSIERTNAPFWPAALRAANLSDLADLHRRWDPTGSAHGGLEVGARRPDGVEWRLQVDTGTAFVGSPDGVPVAMELSEGASLSVGPGRLGLHAAPGSAEPALRGRLPGGEFSIDGELATGPGGPADGGSMELAFDLGPFDPSVSRVLPDELDQALRAIDLRATHVNSDGLRLLGWTGSQATPGLLGGVVLHDGSLQVGAEIGRIHARFGIDAREGRPDPVRIKLGGGHGTFAVRNRFFDGVDGTLRVSEGARRIDIDRLTASLYGGSAWAQARIGGERRDWQLEIGVAGAALQGLTRGGDGTRAFADRGDVSAWLSLGGELGVEGSLRGVGRLEAVKARMAELPLALRLLQATQLMLPLSDSLDTAEANFHVRGSSLRFERLDLTCPTLKLLGSGTVDLDSWNVALRFRNRGTLPLLSDLFGAASDNLFVIDVTGPASDPSVHLTPLPPLGQDPSTQPLPPRVAAASPEHP